MQPCSSGTQTKPFRINVTSKEIADLLLSKKVFLTTREVAEELRTIYPHRIIVVNNIYKRLVEFAGSANAHCVVDLSTSPRRFRLYDIKPIYFKELRRQLVRLGAPEEEIALVPAVEEDAQKGEILKNIIARWNLLVASRNSLHSKANIA